jgi:hypothetical protein
MYLGLNYSPQAFGLKAPYKNYQHDSKIEPLVIPCIHQDTYKNFIVIISA